MIKCQLLCLCEEADAELLESIFSAILAERGWENDVRLECQNGLASLVVDVMEFDVSCLRYIRQVSRVRLKKLGESPNYFLRSLDSTISEF